MPVLIDGYNLLRSIQKSSEDFEAFSDVQLCRFVDEYLKLVDEKGEIVFDGVGPPDKSGFEGMNRLEACFTGRSAEADAVIENAIKASTAPKRLTVVSSDRRIRAAARKRKCEVLKSQDFWIVLCKRLERKKAIQEPRQKRTGLNESETEAWMKFFELKE